MNYFAVLGNKFKFTNVIDEVFCKVSNLCTGNCIFFMKISTCNHDRFPAATLSLLPMINILPKLFTSLLL